MRLAWAALLALVALARGEDAFDKYTPHALKRMVYERGLSCDGCTDEQYRAMVRAHADLPADEELGAEYDEIAAYRQRTEKLNLSRIEFMHQMSDRDADLDEKRAERVWVYFKAQLDSGAVQFHQNGSMKFALPVTHYAARYLPVAVADALEAAFLSARALYVTVPRRYRRRLEARLSLFVDTGTVYAMLTVILVALALDVGTEQIDAFRRRRTEGKERKKRR
jgi:hypothetical protein